MEWGAVAAAAITAVMGFLGTYMSNRKQTALVAYRIQELEKKPNIDLHEIAATYIPVLTEAASVRRT